MNLDSVRDVAELLNDRGLAPKKRFGQNFLVDGNVRRAIARLVSAEPGDVVWEVGPGLGALTELLLDRGARLSVFEVDHGLVAVLRELFADRPNFRIVPGDVTETWRQHAEKDEETPRCIVGNLPYSQAAPIIASFVVSSLRPRQYLFMVQEEVAERMTARPGTRAYAAITVLVQSRHAVQRLMRVQPGSFYPRPEVFSTLLTLRPRADAPYIISSSVLEAVTRAVFHGRRKTIVNSMSRAGLVLGGGRPALSRAEIEGLLTACGIDPAARGETLPVEQIVHLANLAAERFGG
ncbi:MAG: 16S rRNA (adenine(1518)-N(6)/adenine(1519)-N(6))-dimethyltransferase RsmA [Spirochaetaceae bacterium]